MCDHCGCKQVPAIRELVAGHAALPHEADHVRSAQSSGDRLLDHERLNGMVAHPSVRETMITSPYTSSPDITVANARSVFRDDHVHMVLLTERGRLAGTLIRADLLGATDDEAALEHSVMSGRTIAPDASSAEAMSTLEATQGRRLAVVDGEGDLVGLLCLKRSRSGFCSDAGVQDRQSDTQRFQ